MRRMLSWTRVAGMLALFGTLVSCGGDGGSPVTPTPDPDPTPPPAQVPVATLEISGPESAQSWMEKDPLGQLHGCVYTVELEVGGEAESSAEWTGGLVTIDPGAGFQALVVEQSDEEVASYFGTAVLNHGEEHTAELGFFFIFPEASDAPWREGKYKAEWEFWYTTGDLAEPKSVEYAVDCTLPPPLPPIAGEYELESIDGDPLPLEVEPGTTKHANILTFFPDSTYTSTVRTESDGESEETTSARTAYDPYSLSWINMPLVDPTRELSGPASHSDSLIVFQESGGGEWIWRRSEPDAGTSAAQRAVAPARLRDTGLLRARFPTAEVSSLRLR